MTDVFISYKRRLRPKVEAIAAALSELKLTVWFDAALEPGTSFSAEISREVRTAKCVLACFSNDVFPHGGDENGWVLGEATMGRARRALVAVMLEPTDLDPPWNTVHFEDLVGFDPSDSGADRTRWHSVLQAIGKHVGRPGLASFDKARHEASRDLLERWLRNYPTDPLSEAIVATVASLPSDKTPLGTDREPLEYVLDEAPLQGEEPEVVLLSAEEEASIERAIRASLSAEVQLAPEKTMAVLEVAIGEALAENAFELKGRADPSGLGPQTDPTGGGQPDNSDLPQEPQAREPLLRAAAVIAAIAIVAAGIWAGLWLSRPTGSVPPTGDVASLAGSQADESSAPDLVVPPGDLSGTLHCMSQGRLALATAGRAVLSLLKF